MITIHSIEDMLNFYASLGGVRKDSINGFCYMFPRRNSKVRFWGDLHGFSVADADFTYPQNTIVLMRRKITPCILARASTVLSLTLLSLSL